MTAVVVSVHADDGIFSCGEWIAQHAREEEVVVLTLCSGWPPGDGEAMNWQSNLNAEHYDACTFLGATAAGCGFCDGKWPSLRLDDDVDHITKRLRDFSPDTVLVPLGIHHPDHLDFAPLVWEAAHRVKARVAVYADLPYAALYPEETYIRRRALIEELGCRPFESAANGGFFDEKLAACKLYVSQWDRTGDSGRCCLVPERIWWT